MKWNGTVSQPSNARAAIIHTIAARLATANASQASSSRRPVSSHRPNSPSMGRAYHSRVVRRSTS